MSDPAIKRENRVPEWFPAWATRLSDLYFSGTTSMFILHGDVQDLTRTGDGYGTLTDFLAGQISERHVGKLVADRHFARRLVCFAQSHLRRPSFRRSDRRRIFDVVVCAGRRGGKEYEQ